MGSLLFSPWTLADRFRRPDADSGDCSGECPGDRSDETAGLLLSKILYSLN
jgi:hypothetical protein